ncbi:MULTISPECIES: extracellular solute-binding protein [Pseudomonas]|nr:MULTISPECIES: extracellular solute-binding protein [Pseudomonas]AHF67946.1 peptide ABC transporter periplasmic peptide-binding protein [Pseudomonas cichorii JBC1]QVE15017.1 ABC transporter substrate-binding protein [Pseudomonas cichorii]SDO66115.1 microcin C transport system substrate-binding protein [Pseudomonas cichorii]GFM75277.1 ABC transporter substrate-binding protein [Pseudomonas cichorii]GFM93700.1 ABC transporter substrate-binding protein [Pseudomonas cichorii]
MRSVFLPLLTALLVLITGFQQVLAAPQHALTVYGEPPRYPAGFQHFDYVNPEAPKGGSMRRSATDIGQFDHLIPYIDKGIGVTQISGMLYSPLAVKSLDEPYTVYGLIAQKMERLEDGMSLRFYLDPRASFADGTPITASDVKYTYELLMTQGSLQYRTRFEAVKGLEVESESRIRFDFKNNDSRTLPLDLASLPVFPEHWWKTRDFAGGAGFEVPLGSGPYRISHVDPGRSITFERNPNWWGKDLPVNKGMYNFDRFSIEYFGDTDVARQVLKGGAYDYNREYSATGYSIRYDSPALSEGLLQKAHLAKGAVQSTQGFVFNLNRPMFQDRRVRQALSLLWDFEWANRQMMRNMYIRQDSYFSNSELAASQLPTPAELKILEPLRGSIPDEAFTTVFKNPKTDGTGFIRDKQLQALALLQEAGWKPKGDQLVNAQGEPLSFTFLNGQPGFERLLLPYKRNLAQIGIHFDVRRIDAAQYLNRVMARDYDMIVTGYSVSTSPGADLYNSFGSKVANDPGSSNYMALQDPAVDTLIEGLVKAGDKATMTDYAHSLDRVLQWNYYWIPNYYPPGSSTVWWNRFGIPKIQASNSEAIETWWEVSPTPLNNEQFAAKRGASALVSEMK